LFDGDYVLVAEDGANLLSRSTPIAFRASGRFWVNNHAHVLEATPEVDLGFLAHYINTLDLTTIITGTAQPKLTQRALNQIQLFIPPIDEQRLIAARIDRNLSIGDHLRKSLGAALQRATAMQRALVHEALFGGLGSIGRAK
jgi:type I restriction enzyme S subunit